MSLQDHLDQVVSAQIHAIQDTFRDSETHFCKLVDLILKSEGKVVVTGLGKSGLIAHKIAATLTSTGQRAVFLNAAEALHGDLGIVDAGDVVLMLSNGAATPELLSMVPSLRHAKAKIVGIFGRLDTPLAESVDLVIPLVIKEEGCPLRLAPMASTTTSLVIGDALAAILMRHHKFQPEQFAQNHPAGLLGRRLLWKVQDVMRRRPDISIVAPSSSFTDLVAEMTRTNLGIACVCENDLLKGVVTDGDLRRALTRSRPFDLKVDDFMTTSPRTIEEHASLDEAIKVMEEKGKKIYALPVLSDGKICGVVRMHDILS